jgi:GNAT superfamily N-acetyltransferase
LERQQYVIMPLTIECVVAAAQLYHDVWHETQAPLQDVRIAAFRDNEFFIQRVRGSLGSALVAMDGLLCLGYVGWTGNRLDYLFVRGDKRGLGIGRALTHEAIGLIKKSGFNKLYLDCIAGNIQARTFYEREGWMLEVTEIRPVQYGDGFLECEAWVFAKEV